MLVVALFRGIKLMFNKIILSVLMLGLLGGCAINKNVVALEKPLKVNEICIKNNSEVQMKEGFLSELESQLQGHGVKTSVFKGNIPEECQYNLEYTANWKWDMVMYLTYMRLDLREAGNIIASAEYDARRGVGNMRKFGKTSEKMRPLIDEMLNYTSAQ